jgi:hypothetical protein
MPSLIYNGDIGARLVVDTENHTLDPTTTLTLTMKKPSGTIVTLSPPAGGIDYATGIITYPTIAGDLNSAGEYRIQVNAVFSDGDILKSNIDTFNVYENVV